MQSSCSPARAMMRDSANYGDPLKFDWFRFMDSKRRAALEKRHSLGSELKTSTVYSEKSSRLTDVIYWQVWWTGRMAW